jgi:two-component system chemotaxis response regulator CheB
MSAFPSQFPGAAMARPRVLVVDDAAVVRGLFGRWIEADGRFELAPSCGDGRAAIDAARRYRPQVIVLDLEMPVMDGLTALPEILAASPDSAVLIASTLTKRNAQLSMRCLALGATDVVPKPDSGRDLTLSQSFRVEFIGKIAALSQAQVRPKAAAPVAVAGAAAVPAQPRPSADLARLVTQMPRYLLIGASTGGPRAVSRMLGDLAPALPRLATLIVQHMPPMFTASFAEQMGAQVGCPAREPYDGERLTAGTIYVAPGGRHMGLARVGGHPAIRISDDAPVKFCRPAVDVLFRDAAAELGPSALAVVLTGMGSDGADGAQALRASGAAVIAQDEATSVVWGMPGAVTRSGQASAVLPLQDIGPAIKNLVTGGFSARATLAGRGAA